MNKTRATAGLWALQPGIMNQTLGGSNVGRPRLLAHDEPIVTEFTNVAFQTDVAERQRAMDEHAGRALAIGTREIDPRILAQQGAFTLHGDSQDLAELQLDSRPWRMAFRVPNAAKHNLREVLRRFAVSRSSLFPDLGALAEDLTSNFG